MSTIRNLEEIENTALLNVGDKIQITCRNSANTNDVELHFSVGENYLIGDNCSSNDIFRYANISDVNSFVLKHYGYRKTNENDGNFPNCKKNDMEALTKLVTAIYKKIENDNPNIKRKKLTSAEKIRKKNIAIEIEKIRAKARIKRKLELMKKRVAIQKKKRRIAYLRAIGKDKKRNPFFREAMSHVDKGLKRAVSFIQKKGFKFLKVELEANVGFSDLREIRKSFVSIFQNKCNRLRDSTAVYSNFYHDGSVDTELTISVPIQNYMFLPSIIESFCEACAKHGANPRTNIGSIVNAGMHIAIMKEKIYPSRNKIGTDEQMSAFTRSMNKLNYGLVYLGSPNLSTRSLEFRGLNLRNNEKYSTIHFSARSAIEYRVFDPCYSEPLKIYDYIKTIASSLKFWNENYKSSIFRKNGLTRNSREESLCAPDERSITDINKIFDTYPTRARLAKELTLFLAIGNEFGIKKLNKIKRKLFEFNRTESIVRKDRLSSDIVSGTNSDEIKSLPYIPNGWEKAYI